MIQLSNAKCRFRRFLALRLGACLAGGMCVAATC